MLTIAQLKHLQRVVKIFPVAVEAGLNDRTIRSKIANNRELTVTESAAIEAVLQKYGFDRARVSAITPH
jgi:hypothetical protein